jgi:energy-coupling factor transporter ATP-binding protein EcfA2
MSKLADYQIYFKRLTLTNVRSFGDEQELDLTDPDGRPARWTLILGDNGVGKTTLLQCLASMCPVLAAGEPSETADSASGDTLNAPVPTFVEPALLRREDTELSALARTGEELVTLRAVLAAGKPLGARKGKGREIALEATIRVKDGDLVDVTRTKAKVGEAVEPLVVAYGAARHMRYRGSEPFLLHPDTTASLFDPSLELVDAKEILEQLDYGAGKGQPRAKALLGRIKEALARLLPDVERASAIKLYGPAAPGTKGGRSGVQIRTPYGEVPLSALSLGYQTMTAWAIDLAWRLYRQYPDAPDPLQMPAIVIIDELDLHLHPRWQRELRENISAAFPKVQFIATAHSPLLAQSYLDTNLAVIREQDGQALIENNPSVNQKWRIDEVVTSALYEVDSAYSPGIGQSLQERTTLRQKKRLTPAEKERLAELDRLADDLTPEFDTESERALNVIRRAAALLETPNT